MEIGTLLTYFIAAVWVGFGLFCKVLGLAPRQQEIVARILGRSNAWLLTKTIGVAEICMAAWILSGFYSGLNAVVQIVVVLMMNVIEYLFARDLLLWGRLNAVFALLFAALIFINEFVL